MQINRNEYVMNVTLPCKWSSLRAKAGEAEWELDLAGSSKVSKVELTSYCLRKSK